MDKSKLVLALDLETIANPDMVDSLPEPKYGNTKDEAKRAVIFKEKRAKQIDMMGVNPQTNIICCACFQDVYTGQNWSVMLNMVDTEANLLAKTWDILSKFATYVTFNGRMFDVEVLKFHSMLHHVDMQGVHIGQEKYRISNHIDIRTLLGNYNDYATGTLDHFSKIILKEGSEGKGSEVQGWWDNKEYDKIKSHCLDDVNKLSRIYRRLEGYYV